MNNSAKDMRLSMSDEKVKPLCFKVEIDNILRWQKIAADHIAPRVAWNDDQEEMRREAMGQQRSALALLANELHEILVDGPTVGGEGDE